MQEIIINDELKKLLVSDKEIETIFITYLLYNVYKEDDPKEYEFFTYKDYRLFNSLVSNKASDSKLKASLIDIFNEMLSNDLINDVIQEFTDIAVNEGKNLINVLSRVLYMQDKHKNDDIGQEIDNKIKEWIKYINEWDKKTNKDYILDDEIEFNKYLSRILYRLVPTLNYDIYYNDKNRVNYTPRRDFLELFNYKEIPQNDLKDIIKKYIANKISDSAFISGLNDRINRYLSNLYENDNYTNFIKAKKEEIKAIKEKYKITDKKEKALNKKMLQMSILNDEGLKQIGIDPYIDELFSLFMDFKEENDIKDYDDTEDSKIWTKKADTFINNLVNYKEKIKQIDYFNINYTFNNLAYNKYQQNTYKVNIDTTSDNLEPIIEKKPKLSKEELKEKYKDITLLNGEELDYNRKWARSITGKTITNIMDLRENITKKTQNKIDITIKKIAQIEKKPKPTKEDLAQLKELKLVLKEQEQEREIIVNEVKDLKADIELIDKQISDTTDTKQIKSLSSKKKRIKKVLDEKTDILNNEGIYLQADLLSNKLVVAEKVDKDTKESYKLMINNDYDLQNFNSEGRNFLYYIPNIPNIIEELNEDFITLDIDDYLDFTGRPKGNVSRIRRNLQNTLKEMRKETYDYTYLDDKGTLHDDSLVLIGDIKGTEYNGKASVKVQLGATFKDNLKQAFVKSQYVKVNSDVFKIGQGKNNTSENMAKEIFLYLAKLCRIEAKNQVNSGKWSKDLHLDKIITKLAELNLIKYNPNRYNESVKEPLLYALNTGVELGYFTYKTDAFNYYDSVIATNNNGANVQNKIINFERGDKYGIRFTINGDMVDLEHNTKANKTYNKFKNKHKDTKK